MAATRKDIIRMLDSRKHRLERKRVFESSARGFHASEIGSRIASGSNKDVSFASEILQKYRKIRPSDEV